MFEGNTTPTFNKDNGDSDFEDLADSVHSDFSDFSGNEASTLNSIERENMNVNELNLHDDVYYNEPEGDFIPPIGVIPPMGIAAQDVIPPGVDVEEAVIGFNGRPYKRSNQGTEIYIPKKNLFQLVIRPDYASVTRFFIQCTQVDFRERIEDLISRNVWQLILIVALSIWKNAGRQIELLHLKQYILRRPGEPFDKLNTDIWNDTTILQLLKDCFPRLDTDNSMSNSIVARLISISVQYDWNNISTELETFFKINEVLEDVNKDCPLSLDEQQTVVKSWINQWSVKARDTFARVNKGVKTKTVDDFKNHLSAFCTSGREIKQLGLFQGWIMVASPESKFTVPSNSPVT